MDFSGYRYFENHPERGYQNCCCLDQNKMFSLFSRCFASQVNPQQDSEPGKEGWLKRLLTVRNIDPGHKSHSQLLSDKDIVYELVSKLSLAKKKKKKLRCCPPYSRYVLPTLFLRVCKLKKKWQEQEIYSVSRNGSSLKLLHF